MTKNIRATCVCVCLQKKSDELKASEEKVKHLKRHNADLASVTCKFDKKLEPHEHDSMKVCIVLDFFEFVF